LNGGLSRRFGHLLFSSFELNGEKLLYVKPEEFGTQGIQDSVSHLQKYMAYSMGEAMGTTEAKPVGTSEEIGGVSGSTGGGRVNRREGAEAYLILYRTLMASEFLLESSSSALSRPTTPETVFKMLENLEGIISNPNPNPTPIVVPHHLPYC